MQKIKRDYLLYEIDYKRERVPEMEEATASLVEEINEAVVVLKDIANGSTRIDPGTHSTILAARARMRFCFNLLVEARDHYMHIQIVWKLLETGVCTAQTAVDEAEEIADSLLRLYK